MRLGSESGLAFFPMLAIDVDFFFPDWDHAFEFHDEPLRNGVRTCRIDRLFRRINSACTGRKLGPKKIGAGIRSGPA